MSGSGQPVCYGSFLAFPAAICTRFLFAGQLVQINSTILRPFYFFAFKMMSCISWHCSSGDIHSFSCCIMYSFQACFVLYDVVIFKLSFPLTHDACYVGADYHSCHEPSTGWQVIQPQPCEGQNKYFVFNFP